MCYTYGNLCFFFGHNFVHGAKYFHCGNLFTINNSTIHLILWKFVCDINVVFKNQIWWLKQEDLVEVMSEITLWRVHFMQKKSIYF
jgi:hypothetical protein